MMTSAPPTVNASAPRLAPFTKPRRPMFAIVISSRSDFDYLFGEGVRRKVLRHYWAAPLLSQAGAHCARRKRKRPWGAGVFNSQLGGSWGSSLYPRGDFGGLIKSRVNSVKIVSAPLTRWSW